MWSWHCTNYSSKLFLYITMLSITLIIHLTLGGGLVEMIMGVTSGVIVEVAVS